MANNRAMPASSRRKISMAIFRLACPARRKPGSGGQSRCGGRLPSRRALADARETPLNAVVHGKIDQGDYTVEKVYFESVPGLLRHRQPLSAEEARPAKHRRCSSPTATGTTAGSSISAAQAVRKEIADGAERFENGGRSLLQALRVQLARMGCVVFIAT